MDQELVTRFTADISEYKKSITTLQGELKQLSGVTGQVRAATAQAMWEKLRWSEKRPVSKRLR